MPSAFPWSYLALLSTGLVVALSYGILGVQSLAVFAGLAFAAFAVNQTTPALRYMGHSLFCLLALGLLMHWMPGFYNGRAIDPQRFTIEAAPFSMYLNQDKPLVGLWLLLVCPWIISRHSWRHVLKAAAGGLAVSVVFALGGALLLGIISWAPKWPEPAWIWLFNNLVLVSLVEEIIFRGYIQGVLSRRLKSFSHGDLLALAVAALLFGLMHIGSGPLWMLLASLAGVGYGLAYRWGGLLAAICTHFMLNVMHFFLFTYPMLAG